VCFLHETQFVRTNDANMEEAGILEKITRSGFCYPALNQVQFRAHFRAFYPHLAHKSALRAEVAAHLLAPGKRGWSPLATVLPSHAPHFQPHASASHAVTSGVRSCADPPPLAPA